MLQMWLWLNLAPTKAQRAKSVPNQSVCRRHNCYGCRYGGGVGRRHAAVARCQADVIHSHMAPRCLSNRRCPALTRVVNDQRDHARMDFFKFNSSATNLDVSIVAPLSRLLLLQPAPAPGHMVKRAENGKFDRYPHINLCPFHPRDHRPPWTTPTRASSTTISKQQLTAAVS